MITENNNLLVEKYPNIFSRIKYVGVNDGWFELLDNLCRDITLELARDLEVEPVVALQIKEKFGGLRFYYSGGNSVIDALVSQAENASYKICEQCGQPGRARHGGWIKTLCDDHAKH